MKNSTEGCVAHHIPKELLLEFRSAFGLVKSHDRPTSGDVVISLQGHWFSSVLFKIITFATNLALFVSRITVTRFSKGSHVGLIY